MTSDISEKLMEQIRQGEIAMRPRWHFALRSALYLLVFVTVLLITIFVSGFLVLAMRVSGLLEMPGFGFRGFLGFLRAFPWLITLLLLVLMLVVEIYARRYSFCYRLPVLGSLAAVMLIIMAAGLSLGYYLHYSCPGREGMVGSTLSHLKDAAFVRQEMIHAGTVSNFEDRRRFDLETPTDVYEVIITDDFGDIKAEFVKAGDEVLVFGPLDDGVIRAIGMRRLPPEGSRPFQRFGGCPPPAGARHRIPQGVIMVPVSP